MTSNDENDTLIEVFVDTADGEAVREQLPAADLGDGTFQLLVSPLLTLNLAKGDVVRIDDPDAPVTVISRGGNFSVQIYESTIGEEDLARLDSQVRDTFGGSLDLVNDGALSFSVPSQHGIDAVGEFFDDLADDYDTDWVFGNIFKHFDDPDDDTLADWCRDL